MTVTEIDVLEGTRVDREPNKAEIAQAAKDAETIAAIYAAAAKAEAAKAALLARLNITAEEAELLLA